MKDASRVSLYYWAASLITWATQTLSVIASCKNYFLIQKWLLGILKFHITLLKKKKKGKLHVLKEAREQEVKL